MAATLLPNGKQQFVNGNGVPLALGKVYFYVPNTSTFKNTWQDADQQVLNTNPVNLDAAGRAIIYGEGTYRQVVKDAAGNTIWDALTASTGAGGGELQTSPGFNSFVITPETAPAVPNSGLVVNLPAGTAQVNGVNVAIPALTPTLTPDSIQDIWLNQDGSWTIETESTSTYIDLPHFTDKLHVWRVSTGASTITGIYLMGNPNWPTVFQPTDIAATIDTFSQIFYLYPTTTSWSSGLTVSYGELLVTSTGNVYQVSSPGETGLSAPTSTAAGEIVDGTAILYYYCQSSYLGMFRYAPNNGTEYYFTNLGLASVCHKTLLTGSPLGEPAGTTVAALVKTYLQGVFKHLIGDRVNSGTYVFGMKMIAGGYIWLNTTVAGGTAAGSSPFSGTYTPGVSTVVDGTITWLCIYPAYASQKWFWMNVDRTFLTYRSPDSHDSYASTFASLLARYLQLTGDSSWLTGLSTQPSGAGTYWTYEEIFGYIIYQNLDIQIANFLTKTFQYDINPSNGSSFTTQYLEDNCESVKGYRSSAYVYGVLGDSVREAAALANETYVGGGVASLYNTTYNLFATNYGQNVADWALNDQIGWYPYLQAQFFPELCNVATITDDQFKLVRYNVSTRWPNYYADRALDTFPNNFLGYLAAVYWQDTQKAYDFVNKTERYFLSGGTVSQGALTPASATTITEFGYYLATKDALIPAYTILNYDATTTSLNLLSQTGEVVAFTGGGGGGIGGSTGSVDNAILRANGTGGTTLQSSPVLIADTTGVISGTQGLTISGSSSGTLAIKTAAVAGTNTLTLPAGTTDFSSTGGTSQVVKQTSAGGALTVGQLSAADLSNTTTGSGAIVLSTAPTLASTVTIGTPSGTTGAVLLRGTTSGTVTLSTADAAGTWTLKLPTTAGTSNYFLQTDGSGNTTWAAGGSGSAGFDAITSGTNTTAAMVVGSGATLGVSGSGTIAATSVANATLTTAITVNTGTVTLKGDVSNTSVLTIGAGAVSVSGTNTGDQTITLSGAVTGSGTSSITTTFATPGTLTVASTNSNADAHTHAITSSSTPGAAASILATDSSGVLGSTGSRIVKIWATDLTVTNAISGSITGNAATVTTNANLTGAITSSGNATSLGSFSSADLATALTDETGTGTVVFSSAIREKLTTNRTYYVRTDGSDSNNGLSNTAGGAFLTLQKAADTLSVLDLSGYTVTVQVGAGTYTAGFLLNGKVIGQGNHTNVVVLGDTTTPTNVIITIGTSTAFWATGGAQFSVGGFSISGTGGSSGGTALRADGAGSYVYCNQAMEYGVLGYCFFASLYGQIFQITGNYTISGAHYSHITAIQQAMITNRNCTVTITGTPAWGLQFATTSRLSLIENFSVTYSGAATGKRYDAITNSVIFTNGGGASYFPGNVAGTTATGGQYV